MNEYETDPTAADTDGDGLEDNVELNEYETDPTAADTDEDGLEDSAELDVGTDPREPDTDNDGLPDGAEVRKTNLYPNADPLHKDVYLEIDYTEKVSERALRDTIDLYEDAPFDNPDGENGVTLHIYWDVKIECNGPVAPRMFGNCNGSDVTEEGYYNLKFVNEVEDTDGSDVGGFVQGVGSQVMVVEVKGNSNDRVDSIFAHELGHLFGIRGESFAGNPSSGPGVDSEEIPFHQYQSVMNYNSESTYVGYSAGTESDAAINDWAIIRSGINQTREDYEEILAAEDERD